MPDLEARREIANVFGPHGQCRRSQHLQYRFVIDSFSLRRPCYTSESHSRSNPHCVQEFAMVVPPSNLNHSLLQIHWKTTKTTMWNGGMQERVSSHAYGIRIPHTCNANVYVYIFYKTEWWCVPIDGQGSTLRGRCSYFNCGKRTIHWPRAKIHAIHFNQIWLSKLIVDIGQYVNCLR